MATPFYCPKPTTGIVVQAEMVETTKPGAAWRTFAPTGNRRAFIEGVRVPLFVARLAWRVCRVLPREVA